MIVFREMPSRFDGNRKLHGIASVSCVRVERPTSCDDVHSVARNQLGRSSHADVL